MNEYYLYEHWRPDKSVCFYVGKGKGNRAWVMSKDRNNHHRAIISKLISMGLSVDVRIIIGRLSEEVALLLEIERIAMYGMENLANMTAGGDGLSNPTEEVRAKMRASSKLRWANEEMKVQHGRAVVAGMIKNNSGAKSAAKLRGRKQSAETIEKKALALRGKPHTPERRKKASGSGNPFYGKRHSEETIARLASLRRGTKLSEETRARMRTSQAERRTKEALAKPPKIITLVDRKPYRHPPEVIEKMRVAAKIRGVSPLTRAAQKAAVTGKRRPPITEETRIKMRLASISREKVKRQKRQKRVAKK